MIAARIADLYVDMQNVYESESQAMRERRSANSETAKELENVSCIHSEIMHKT